MKMSDEKDSQGLTPSTPSKQLQTFVPETPSPVFSGFRQKNGHAKSPSKKYWFEDVQGKVGAEAMVNGTIKTVGYSNNRKKEAFDALKRMRDKKNTKDDVLGRKKADKRHRPYHVWPSDSDTDSDEKQTFEAFFKKKMEATSRSQHSNQPTSNSPVQPLKKRIRLGLTSLRNSTISSSNTSDECSKKKDSDFTCGLAKPSGCDFVSARTAMEMSPADSDVETGISNIISHKSELNRKSSQFNLPQQRKIRNRKVKFTPLHTISSDEEDSQVGMDLTPPRDSRIIQTTGNRQVNPESPSKLHVNHFYKKTSAKNEKVKSRHQGTHQKRSHRASKGKPKSSRLARPIDAPNIIDVDEDDAVVVVNQLETDETMAKKLQEEMDREFALTLANVASPARGQTPHHQQLHMFPTGSMLPTEREMGFEQGVFPQDFPFMANGNWGQSPLALLTSHVALLGGADGWDSPRRMQVSSRSTRRGNRGRHGARTTVRMNSPGVNGEDYEALLDLAERLGDVKPKGLSKSQIDCLPVKKYLPSSGESTQNEECLVCMCEFERDENVRILTCFHDFHSTCIDKWLKSNSTCPICRVEVKLA